MRARLLNIVLLIALLLGSWEALHHLVGAIAISSPAETVQRLAAMMATDSFWMHARETMWAFAQALAIALSGGLFIGLVLGGYRPAGTVFEPILVAIYSVPKVTLYPVILLIFGLGISAKVAFGAIHGIVPVAMFTMNAVRSLNQTYLRAARSMRLTPGQTALRILVPATLPEIVTGFRVGFSLTLLGSLIGELFASQRGLGFLIMRAVNVYDVKTIFAVTLLIAVVAIIVNSAMLALDQRLHRRL
ncbi:MAG: ABC transporter permease subunit [Alphaproteobacteria bacterium]|nr:ABC transporter permease subunit [Alphaproteobacteria bacterium]